MTQPFLKSVFIATISHITDENGNRETHSTPAWPMIDFFYKRCEELVVVELPLPRKKMFFRPQAVRYLKGIFIERRLMPWILSWPFSIPEHKIKPRTYLRLKIRDMLAVIWFMLVFRHCFEIFIGVESILAMFGGVLKKIGVVKLSVYYISDWAPVKFQIAFLNWLYIKMDWLACKWSDYIWNYTYTISEARKDILKYKMDKIGKELWVPFGFLPGGVIHPDEKDVDRRRMIYCGGFGPEYGVDLIIESLPLIRKQIPDVKIDILGTGSGMEALKERAKTLGVDDCIVWCGYVSDRKEILKHYLKASISLAPFAPLGNSVKKYGDVIKIRESIGCGVPVITTTVPPSHKEVLEKGLGEVIEYTPAALANVVIKLLSDDSYYFAVRRRVLLASKENLWENIYGRTLNAMGYDATPIYKEKSE